MAYVWKDTALADRLEKEAADLKRRFNRDFWVEDDEYFGRGPRFAERATGQDR